MPAKYPLPESARDFLDTLRPVRKHGTCSAYAGTLRGFYAWLDAQDLSCSALDRRDLQRWLNALADRRLTPGTRHAHIIRLRCYLRGSPNVGTSMPTRTRCFATRTYRSSPIACRVPSPWTPTAKYSVGLKPTTRSTGKP